MTKHTTARPAWAEAAAGDPDLAPALDLLKLAESGLLCRHAGAQRIASRLLRWLEMDGADVPLDVFIGLAGTGQRAARQRMRLGTRDALIRRLAQTTYPTLNYKAGGDKIARSWCRYAAGDLRRDLASGTVPHREPAQTFFSLARRGHEPLSKHTIRKILARQADHLNPVEPASGKDENFPERGASDDEDDKAKAPCSSR
ncbi:hypothetical protein [Roseovarius sp.]|uniref:hypothetical protein n=1 Tax=Roseovarius sp. TaxID=1486281 RepID=UPI003BADA556